jgi:hypothetical protein
MKGYMVYFLLCVGLFFALLIGIAGYYYRRSRKSSGTSWEQLSGRLAYVDRNCVEKIALDAIDESGQRRRDDAAMELEPDEIWQLIGGLKGIEAMERNSLVFIDMAFYLQQWYPEALVTAEELRLNAREIEWQVSRLRSAEQTGKLAISFASYAQNAVVAYYIMTRRLLALYEQGDLSMLVNLERSI